MISNGYRSSALLCMTLRCINLFKDMARPCLVEKALPIFKSNASSILLLREVMQSVLVLQAYHAALFFKIYVGSTWGWNNGTKLLPNT